MRLINSLKFGWIFRKINGFNAGFYLSHYDDLKNIGTSRQAFEHYMRHGRTEGRFPNELAYFESIAGDLRVDFDPVAYKFYNKDLQNRFESEEELFHHYLRHGRNEGRVCRFPYDDRPDAVLPDAEKWQSIFSVPEFLAWCGHELETLPTSREEALAVFSQQGIARIWPINFDYAFDPEFVRHNNVMPQHKGKSDADLYGIWLSEGFAAGLPPNERTFLAPYLGGMPFPLSFDWEGFARKVGLPRGTTRSQAVVALFKAPERTVLASIDLMGGDAGWLLGRIGDRFLTQGESRAAIALLTQSAALLPTAGTLCLMGDAYRARGALAKALEAYLAALDLDRAPMSAFIHAATIHASRQEFPEAFAVLRRASPSWRQKAEFGSKFHEIVQLYFEHRSAAAHALYRQGGADSADPAARQAADDLLAATLDEIHAAYLEMDSLPAPTGGNPVGYVAILANDDLRQCTHYRIEQKALQFERAGIAARIFSHGDVQGFMDSLVGARAAIFYRVAAVPSVLRAIQHANSMGLETYYEIDDLIFDSGCYPDPYPSFEGQISTADYAGLQFGVPLFRYAMAMCKASIASTPALAERMQAVTITPASLLIRNGLDRRNEAAIGIGANPIGRCDGRVRLFYGSGTKAHNADFNELVAPVLLDLMAKYPQVDLVIAGHLKPRPELVSMAGRVIAYPFISDIDTYWSVLASCDVNLAVLKPGIVADCKSEIKWLEAAVLQVPSIVSGTRTYREMIEDGVDGLVADTKREWYDALEGVITQPQLRRRIGASARGKALRDYGIEVGARTLAAAFGGAKAFRSPARPAPLRVLVCNVFFAPQSYGGATRVVENNVGAFVERYPDLEIGVFCSDESDTSPGRLTMRSENGVPVYRLSLPQDADVDWRPFNEDHAAPFERVLDHFRPDLIHFHCIQRLSATIVEVALRRVLPYVVTLHDGWWISDHQFLVDRDGFLRQPGTDIVGDTARSCHPLRSMARRQRLASLLNRSAANLSVSRPFAAIYSRAGISRVRVIENDTPFIEELGRTPRSDGRVALGHLGGRSPHKGASLVEASLRRGAYKNLHLTMMDGTMAPGQAIETIWGTTPVTLIGPYPQSQIAQVYCQLDVLLAPSTWPESFGLVTREALGCGLWVVASDLGAIGQAVHNDRNGYVIDVRSIEGLSTILSKMDADPQRYQQRLPTTDATPRSSADQAAELYVLYHEISGL